MEILTKDRKEGRSARETAKRLGRSRASVYYKAYQSTFEKKPRNLWKPEEDRILSKMRGEGNGWKLIGASLNRSSPGCWARWAKHLKYKTGLGEKDEIK
jgi:hypothetical protein